MESTNHTPIDQDRKVQANKGRGVFAWGNADRGQLGLHTVEVHLSPQLLPQFMKKKVIKIATGIAHSVALTEDGTIWGWGDNSKGQLGNFRNGWFGGSVFAEPHKIANPKTRYTDVACGACFTVFLTEDGTLSGRGTVSLEQFSKKTYTAIFAGEYSVGAIRKSKDSKDILDYWNGKSMETIVKDEPFIEVSCGATSSAFITADGKAWLSIDDQPFEQFDVEKVHGNFKSVTCTYYSTYLITESGTVVHIGTPRKINKAVENIPSLKIKPKKVVASSNDEFAAILTQDGTLYTWGAGNHGQLGRGKRRDNYAIPQPIENAKFLDIACGSEHFIATELLYVSSYTKDMLPAINQDVTSDVTLVFQDEIKLKVHRIFLQTRLPEFFRALSPQILEGPHPVLKLKDFQLEISSKTMEYILKWVYGAAICPQFRGIKEFSEKFQVPDLLRRKKTEGDDIQLANAFQDEKGHPLKNFADFKIQLEGGHVIAHRVFLANRCPHFKIIFSGNFQESRDTQVEIPDISVKTFEEILQFMMCDQVDIHSDNVMDLWYGSIYLSMLDLQQKCEEFMEENLDVDNAVDIANEAHRHNSLHLTKSALQYIAKMRLQIEDALFQTLESELVEQLGQIRHMHV